MTIKRSAVVVIAVTLQRLAEGVTSGWSFEEQLVLDALRRSTSVLNKATDEDLGEYIRYLSTDQLRGVVSNVKGIYHELLFANAENTDGDAISCQLFEASNHPGSDVEFIVGDQSICAVQLKAVSSPHALFEHFEKYPDIDVYATTEIASQTTEVRDSGFLNSDLTRDVETTLEKLSCDDFGGDIIASGASSSLITSALLARNVLQKGGMSKAEFASALKDTGIGVVAATAIDTLISLVP